MFSVAGGRQGTGRRLTSFVGGVLVLQLMVRLVIFQQNSEERQLDLVYYGNLTACISSGSLVCWILVRILRQHEEVWHLYEATHRIVRSAARQQVAVWRHCGHFMSATLERLRLATSSCISRCCTRLSVKGLKSSLHDSGETGRDQCPSLVRHPDHPASPVIEPVVAHQMDRIELPARANNGMAAKKA
jgi:hypothetical protein